MSYLVKQLQENNYNFNIIVIVILFLPVFQVCIN